MNLQALTKKKQNIRSYYEDIREDLRLDSCRDISTSLPKGQSPTGDVLKGLLRLLGRRYRVIEAGSCYRKHPQVISDMMRQRSMWYRETEHREYIFFPFFQFPLRHSVFFLIVPASSFNIILGYYITCNLHTQRQISELPMSHCNFVSFINSQQFKIRPWGVLTKLIYTIPTPLIFPCRQDLRQIIKQTRGPERQTVQMRHQTYLQVLNTAEVPCSEASGTTGDFRNQPGGGRHMHHYRTTDSVWEEERRRDRPLSPPLPPRLHNTVRREPQHGKPV